MTLQWGRSPIDETKTDAILDRFARGKLNLFASLDQLRQVYEGRLNRKKVTQTDFFNGYVSTQTREGDKVTQGMAFDAYCAEGSFDPLQHKEKLLAPLHALIGLTEVKRTIDELYAYLVVQGLRRQAGLKLNQTVLHMIFSGRPGTGKTTVARLLGPVLRALGVLSRGHVVEVERADLVGEYIGHTAQKTRALLEQAMGGILFIDEAYAIARGGEKDFGREAIDTLVKGIEDRNRDLVVILAGYEMEMKYFLSVNPGLSSRFPLHVFFPDYSVQELVQIASAMIRERQYHLAPDGLVSLRQQLRKEQMQAEFSNARTVRNLVERAIRKQAVRVLEQKEQTRQDLMTLIGSDFRGEVDHESMPSDWATGSWKNLP
ncbi:AAA family ATPase [Sulfoacidibacillus thermotolerans]|uniref:AAA+ ATPase domain-containing protein n=1 Tax=Sulfoacidibacillus thermotolerans TaxID=1765684 RepID=A0A2U3DAU2_SULT2|nr:AAA family ATPase [Sulfoacidibacillus thermotolerans]PWI58383.1 hypothetical protein BM613_03985 [Sulfoacidibacillus thermotolerans]